MTSGGPISVPTSSNRRATSAGSSALHANALAPVSLQSACNFEELRAASAIRMPAFANVRASDALSPSPAPTIRHVLYGEWLMRYLQLAFVDQARAGLSISSRRTTQSVIRGVARDLPAKHVIRPAEIHEDDRQ